MLGVSFAGTWEIETSSTVVWEFGTLKSTASVGGDLIGTALADVWRIGAETSLADVCRIGIETPLGDLGVRTFIADVWRIEAATSLLGFWSGARAFAA